MTPAPKKPPRPTTTTADGRTIEPISAWKKPIPRPIPQSQQRKPKR